MPRIQEYVERQGAPGPSPRFSPDSNNGVGRGLEALGQGVAQLGEGITQKISQEETSDMHAKMADLHNRMTQDWDQNIRTADPNNPNYKDLVNNYLQKYDDESSKIRDNLTTRDSQLRYDQTNTDLRSSFAHLAVESQAHLAGEKAVLDKQNELKSYGAAALLNPQGAEASRTALKDSIFGDSRYNRVQAQEIWQKSNADLTQNQIRGFAQLNPQQTLDAIHQGVFSAHMTGDQLHEVEKETRAIITARYVDQERQHTLTKQALEEQQGVIEKDFLGKVVNNQLSANDVLTSPQGRVLTSGQQEHFLRMMGVVNAAGGVDKMRTDPAFFQNTLTRIMLPENDPNHLGSTNDIYQGVIDGKLAPHDADWLAQYQSGKKTIQGQMEMKLFEHFMTETKKSITKSNDLIGFQDPDGDRRWYEFSYKAMNEVLKRQQAGQSLQPLIDPKSPDYLRNSVAPYQRTFQESMKEFSKKAKAQSAAETNPIQLPKKNAGESDTDYFKRIQAPGMAK